MGCLETDPICYMQDLYHLQYHPPNPRSLGSIVYVRSCRISSINSITPKTLEALVV